MSTNLGRFKASARPLRMTDGATKTKVCEFVGPEYVAERVDDRLVIFQIGNDGMPGAKMVGDAPPRTLAELNQQNAARKSAR